MKVGGLFSGIGGMELGLQRAGFEIAWMCEIDPYCRRVLAKHWPSVPIYEDAREVAADAVEPVDIISGGFPCQDISHAGRGAGIDGHRSGLWSEIARLVREIRPRYLLVENVAALLDRGLGRVLSDLSAIRYDAEWSTVSACSLGTPHVRQRVFVVAYPNGQHGREGLWNTAARARWPLQAIYDLEGSRAGWRTRLANPSALYGGADGVPFGMDRNRAIGNAVVPQVVEQIGRAIITANSERLAA